MKARQYFLLKTPILLQDEGITILGGFPKYTGIIGRMSESQVPTKIFKSICYKILDIIGHLLMGMNKYILIIRDSDNNIYALQSYDGKYFLAKDAPILDYDTGEYLGSAHILSDLNDQNKEQYHNVFKKLEIVLIDDKHQKIWRGFGDTEGMEKLNK